MLTIIAAAGLVSAPELLPGGVAYPSIHIRNGRSAAALIDVLVSPEGLPISCQTLEVFGDEKFGDSICELQGAVRFKPALNDAGEPSFGMFRVLVKYVLIGTKQGKLVNALSFPVELEVGGMAVRVGSRWPDAEEFEKKSGKAVFIGRPDVTFYVPTLPAGKESFLDQRVVVAINTSGAPTACVADPSDGVSAKHPNYANVACQQLLGMNIADPITVGQSSISYVRSIQVRFAIAASGSEEY